mgnify:CR=1 FL=1
MKIPLNPLWIIVSSLLLLASCGGENKPGGAVPGAAPTVKDYAVVEVSPQVFVVNSSYPAIIEGEQNL